MIKGLMIFIIVMILIYHALKSGGVNILGAKQ